MARAYDEEDHPLCERGIEQRNHALLRRYREFRRGADAVAAAWRAHPEVIAVSLIGSVARAPWKEVPPRFGAHHGPLRGPRARRRSRADSLVRQTLDRQVQGLQAVLANDGTRCSAGRNRSSLVAAEPFEHALQDFEIASVVDDETSSLGVDSRGAPQRLRECRLE